MILFLFDVPDDYKYWSKIQDSEGQIHIGFIDQDDNFIFHDNTKPSLPNGTFTITEKTDIPRLKRR